MLSCRGNDKLCELPIYKPSELNCQSRIINSGFNSQARFSSPSLTLKSRFINHMRHQSIKSSILLWWLVTHLASVTTRYGHTNLISRVESLRYPYGQRTTIRRAMRKCRHSYSWINPLKLWTRLGEINGTLPWGVNMLAASLKFKPFHRPLRWSSHKVNWSVDLVLALSNRNSRLKMSKKVKRARKTIKMKRMNRQSRILRPSLIERNSKNT